MDSPDPNRNMKKRFPRLLQQYRVNPDHSEALLRFANVNHRSERYDLGAVGTQAVLAGIW